MKNCMTLFEYVQTVQFCKAIGEDNKAYKYSNYLIGTCMEKSNNIDTSDASDNRKESIR